MEWISVEEMYEYKNPLVSCDVCKKETFPQDVHFMESFHHETQIVVCKTCLSNFESVQKGEDDL